MSPWSRRNLYRAPPDHKAAGPRRFTGEAETSDGVGKAIQSNGTGSGVAKERSATVRPLWVKSRHRSASNQCLLYPQKRTSIIVNAMSASCHSARSTISLAIRKARMDGHLQKV